MINKLSANSMVLTKAGYKKVTSLTGSDEIVVLDESGIMKGFESRFCLTTFGSDPSRVRKWVRVSCRNGVRFDVPYGESVKVKGMLRWKEVDPVDVGLGDVVRYGGIGTKNKCDDELCEWAWFFGRFVENGYGNKDCYCWNNCYEDVVEWLDEQGVRYVVSRDLLFVEEKSVGVKWKVVKECFGDWLWCSEFRNGVG